MRRGELASVPAEGVLRPISSEGVAVTGSGRRLEAEAGGELSDRLQGLGELPLGGAVITPAGNLSASFVIHVVVQSAEEAISTPTLERALVNGLRRASEWGLESLVLPPVGLGPGALEPEDAAGVLVDVLREHLRGDHDPRELTIVVESDYEEDLYLHLVAVTQRLDGGHG